MKKVIMVLSFILILVLAACSQKDDAAEDKNENAAADSSENSVQQVEGDTKQIEYLKEEYTLPSNVDRIVITGAMEAMEDAVSLGVEPVGAVTVAGQFELYASVTKNAESIGEKQEPNFEKILELKPDVILGSDKFPDEVIEKLEKIAPTIKVSHISSDWEDNLHLMGELSGKADEAEQLLEDYHAELEKIKPSIQEAMDGKKVAAIRIRGGEMFIYPQDVFFNSVLYEQLGLEVPEEVGKAEAQEALSVEQLASMNPDYLIIQVQDGNNDENNKVYEEMKKDPIVQNVTAFKEDQVFVNMVDSLLEGGPAYSRTVFLEKLQENLK